MGAGTGGECTTKKACGRSTLDKGLLVALDDVRTQEPCRSPHKAIASGKDSRSRLMTTSIYDEKTRGAHTALLKYSFSNTGASKGQGFTQKRWAQIEIQYLRRMKEDETVVQKIPKKTLENQWCEVWTIPQTNWSRAVKRAQRGESALRMPKRGSRLFLPGEDLRNRLIKRMVSWDNWHCTGGFRISCGELESPRRKLLRMWLRAGGIPTPSRKGTLYRKKQIKNMKSRLASGALIRPF